MVIVKMGRENICVHLEDLFCKYQGIKKVPQEKETSSPTKSKVRQMFGAEPFCTS